MARKLYIPFHLAGEEIVIDHELAEAADLTAWAARFQLGTAGYRDLADTADLFQLGVPFNPLTMAIMTEASCRLLEPGATVHLGGEVRAWTQEHIDLAARIYAAHGIACRLRGDRDADGPIRTTPIWLSSFGVFYEELAGGENFTASHSQSFKGGRKPMDGRGMQLLDAAAAIEQGVRDIVAAVRRDGRYVIKLAPSLSPLIRRDFDVVAPYARYLQTIVDREALAAVTAAGAAGFRVAVSTQGGAMGRTSRQIFDLLGIPTGPGGIVEYLHFAESPTYHGIGLVDGVNHGVDPGKWQIYKNIGAQAILLGGHASVVFIWDPDGDRFNMVTVADPDTAARAQANGLEVEAGDAARSIVYFKPNQIYLMLLAFRLESARRQGLLDRRPWLLMETYPTSRSLAELAARFRVPTFFTPVGFKHFGNACARLEEQELAGAAELALTDSRGRRHTFPAGTRILLMAEESGGAALGGTEMLHSRSGARSMLALKEKDAFQVGVTAMALAGRLHLDGSSFARYYLEVLERYDIRHRFYERQDVTLFDESLAGPARETAMAEGNRKKDRAVRFFRSLAERLGRGELNPGAVTRILQERGPAGFVFPPVQDVYWAGDGTLIEFDGLWWQLRASGTDAVLRYYAEGKLREEVRWLNDALMRLDVSE
ncbi:MAG TPA: hypothetical protein PLU41_14060 [Acidobacteriota bacterium]|jgi:phosphomannomutase|nr:hypothetical protein [Acidobacteriota bacterium]HPB29525.1 hypothetical protein [Acidobacteriota bacterium]HQO27145.1 hypothetical protein [Acidobacteriota bacterium]HQP75145.1 hypothetical protein [Acidobacteriota bacterium]